MKRILVMFLTVCIFASCSAEVYETDAASQSGAMTVGLAMSESGTTSTEADANAASDNYSIEFIYPDKSSDEQENMAEKIYDAMDDGRIRGAISKYSTAEENSFKYQVICNEYCADFDNDKDNEMFVYFTVYIPSVLPDTHYRELWYTDGGNAAFVANTYGRNSYNDILQADNGPALFYCVDNLVMGAPWQTARRYTVRNNQPAEYLLPDKSKYFAFAVSGEDNSIHNVYIGSCDDEADVIASALQRAEESSTPFQTLGWIDGEIKITSGFGSE